MAQQFSGAPYLNSYGVQDRYGYQGEVSPDVAIEEQALNRKQQIANLLLQQGLQGAGSGQMVGRFYVPTSGTQHAAKIGEILAGAIGSHTIDTKRQDLSTNMNEERARAVQRYIEQTQGKQVPERTLPQGTPDQVVPVQGPPNITQPADPTTGEFGAIQEQPAQITIPGTPPTQGPVNEAQFQAPDQMASRMAVMEAMSHADPRVREAVRFMEQANAHEEEKKAAQAFQAQQADENRAVRREGIEANALTRVEQMKNTMQLTQMQIDARMQAGQDANALKKQLANQAAELKKLEIQTKKETAQQHNEVIKEIAGSKKQTEKTPLSPTAQKELFEADDTVNASRNVVTSLKKALEINNSAFEGGTAAARSKILGYVPGQFEGENATVELNNIVTGQALEQLRAVFGGMPTEGERKILLEVQGSVNMKASQRKEIYERAIQMAERRMEQNTQKAKQLREGTFFTPNGGPAAPAQSAPSDTRGPQVGTVESGYRFKGGDPGKAESWEKVQ